MRFGLIGAGGIGSVRAAALAETPGCSLSAVFDVDAAAARALAGDAAVFDSAADLAASDACDAVIVSSPPNFHAEQTIACLRGGKHVLVEKPMASSLEECAAMVAAAREADRVLTVGFNHRYFAGIRAVREAIRSAEIGQLSYVRAYAGHTGLSEFRSKWMYDKDVMGGGTLMDNGIHVLDLTQHLMGGVASVTGIAKTDIWKLDRSECNGFALLRGPTGVVGSLHSSWTEWKGYRFYVEAYGDRGMARAYYAPMQSTVITMDKPGGRPRTRRNFYVGAIFREKFRGWQSTVIQTFVDEFTEFVALTRGEAGDGVIATGVDGYRAIEIANAVYASSESGGTVDLVESV